VRPTALPPIATAAPAAPAADVWSTANVPDADRDHSRYLPPERREKP
jgi:hypothetical protein